MVDIADRLTSYPLVVLHGSQNLSMLCANSACTHMSLSNNVSSASSSNMPCPPLALPGFTTAPILTISHKSRHGGRIIPPCFLLETSPTKEESVRCQSVSRKNQRRRGMTMQARAVETARVYAAEAPRSDFTPHRLLGVIARVTTSRFALKTRSSPNSGASGASSASGAGDGTRGHRAERARGGC